MKTRTILILVTTLTLGAVSFGGCSGRPASESGEALLESMARASLSQLDGEIRIAGLAEPVEIVRDTWGVAHIYAQTVEDLFLRIVNIPEKTCLIIMDFDGSRGFNFKLFGCRNQLFCTFKIKVALGGHTA